MRASDYSDVFVSYRRKDVEFTQKLVEALQAQGKEVWVDWEDIPPGSEGFSDDIRRGLEGADAFIAILSPDYLDSTYCVDLELGNAIKMNKKIIPIVLHKFDDYPVPAGIGHINWVYFTPHAGHRNTFEESFPKVIDALEVDLVYNREHKRYLLRALEWDKGNRSNSFLLTGDEISTAESWLASGASKTPSPTELHGEYIQASRKQATRRQRMLFTGISIALAVSVILTIISLIGFQRASVAEAEAYVARDAARDARDQAERSAEVSKSLALSSAALQPDNEAIKIRLALEATQIENPPLDVLRTLMITAYEPGVRHNFMIPTEGFDFMGGAEGKLSVYGGGYSPDGETAVIENKLYDLETGAVLVEFKDAPAVPVVAEFTPDGQRVVIAGDRAGYWVTDETIIAKEIFMGLYDVNTGELLREYDTQSAITHVQISADGTQLAATHHTDSETFLYDLETGEQLRSLAFASNAVALNPDFSRIASREDSVGLDGYASSIIRVTDLVTGEVINEISTESLFADLLHFSTDGETIYVAGDSQILAFSVSNGALTTIFDVPNRNFIQSIELSPDGQSLIGVQSTQVNLWDVQSGNLLQTFDAHSDMILHANFAGNSQQIVSMDTSGNVKTWDLSDGAVDDTFYVESEAVFNNTTNELIVTENGITRIDIDSLESTVIPAEFPPDTQQIGYFPEQDWLILRDTTPSNVLYAIDATSGEIISSVSALTVLPIIPDSDDDSVQPFINATRVDLLPDMQHIIVWFDHGFITEDGVSTTVAVPVYALWDVYSNELLPTAEVLASTELFNISMNVHPDGTLYVMGMQNGEIVLVRFDLETQQILSEFELEEDSIGFDFSPDGTQLVEVIAPFVGNKSTIKMRDAFTGEVLNDYPSSFECCSVPAIDWTNGYVQSFAPGGGRGGGGIIGQSLGVNFSGVAQNAFTADLETGAVLKEYDILGQFLGFDAEGSRFVVANWPLIYIVRNDTLASLIEWTCENRFVPTLTDDQLKQFDLSAQSSVCQ